MTPYDPSSLSTVGRWLAQSPVGPFETSDAKGLARISACIRATSSTRKCSGRYMGYPRIGLCKRNSLDAGKTRLFVPALTSTELIWRHTRHVRFGSQADIGASLHNVRFTPKSWHQLMVLRSPLSAKSGHCSASIGVRYSPESGGGLTLLTPSADTEPDSRFQTVTEGSHGNAICRRAGFQRLPS